MRRALAAVALVAVLAPACGGGPPLALRTGAAVSTSARVHLGDSVSVGVIDLAAYSGDEPAVLDAVSPTDPVEGVTVLGYVVLTDPGDGIRSEDGFPPPNLQTADLQGFTLRPGSGPVQIVAGFRLEHEGVHHIQGFTLRYHVGSTSYEQPFDEAASICSFGFSAC